MIPDEMKELSLSSLNAVYYVPPWGMNRSEKENAFIECCSGYFVMCLCGAVYVCAHTKFICGNTW